MKTDHPCPECNGDGYVECSQCGSEDDCENCAGTGIDPSVVDTYSYQRACRALLLEHGGTTGWIEDGKLMGRMALNDHSQRVAIADYLEESDGQEVRT